MSYGQNIAVAAATSMFSEGPLEDVGVTFGALDCVICENVAVAAATSIFPKNAWVHLGAPNSRMLLWLQREAYFGGGPSALLKF